MKKIIYTALVIALFISCEKVLDKPNPSYISPEIWDDEAAASLYINKLYDMVMPTFSKNFGIPSETSSASLSDESSGGESFLYGWLTTESVGDYSELNFRIIRDINIAIDEALKGGMSSEGKDRILGQTYFMRAWRYWELVKLYGGVPIVLVSLDPYNDELDIPRSKTSECIEIIVEDLDSAISKLPSSWPSSERGRVTRGAAAALKGRVLLFWASPQFNPEYKKDRWQRAYDANLQAKVILEEEGYCLEKNFEDIFIVEEGNTEFIFGRLYEFDAGKTHQWENSCRPVEVGLSGATSNNPTWQLVEAFPMKNGLSTGHPESGYNETYYWIDRDPRFYSTIAYNGCVWEFEGFPAGRKQWHYYYSVADTNIASAEGPITTTTGFYCRKAINPDIPKEEVTEVGTDWPEMRFAEVLLNLAECANETDKIQEAYNELFAIRDRAGIENGAGYYGLDDNMTKEEMTAAIMHERQIEFAFENKRHWDLRRRNLFEEEINGTRRTGIINILKNLPDSTGEATHQWFMTVRDTINLDEDFEQYFYTEVWVKDQQSEINYPQPLYNFYAIPPPMLDRSPAVEQTLGWDNGTFDPLEE
jgi:hypothetical protein